MAESRLERSYNYYQLSPDTLAITIDVLDTGPGITTPTVPQPAAPLALTDPTIKLESRFARPTVDFIDVDFEVISDPGAARPTLARYESNPLSDGGRPRRAPISRPQATPSGGPSGGPSGSPGAGQALLSTNVLSLAYDFLKVVEEFIPPPCPELTIEALRDNLQIYTEEANTAIAAANTAQELEQLTLLYGGLTTGGLGLAAALSTVFFPPATPFLAGAAATSGKYWLGTQLATSSARIATQHVARNNLIHRARLTTTSSFVQNPDLDPCAVAEPVLLRERPERSCACVAAVPEWWPRRVGADRPQLIIQFSEFFEGGVLGPPMFQISIPWADTPDPLQSSPIAGYLKGNVSGTLVLPDNSKLIVNAADISTAESLIFQAVSVIDPDRLPDPIVPKIGPRGGKPVEVRPVVPKIMRYFPDGQRDTYPKWEVYL